MTPISRLAACPSSPNGQCDFYSMGEFPDRSGIIGKVEVLRCRHCGLGISSPPMPDVAFLYADRTSPDFQPGNRSFLAHVIKQVAFRRQARSLMKALPARPRRVIDFGCGGGLFTRCLGDELRDSEVIGMDFHVDPPTDLADRPYLSLRDAETIAGTADVVLAMHVLEHDDDACGLIRRIAAMARPGGTVVIEVPNIDCIWADVFGTSWDAWYLPFHRSHFGRKSLRALAEANGLSIEKEVDVCVPTMGRTAANLMRARNTVTFLLLGILLHPAQWLGERLSRRPSALRIIARKDNRSELG